jgi:hypothetical protein
MINQAKPFSRIARVVFVLPGDQQILLNLSVVRLQENSPVKKTIDKQHLLNDPEN